jgi:HAD superfamily hydrolase (TIGR01484 family)
MVQQPKYFEEIPSEDIRNIRIIMTDIDDTLTENNKLLPEAFSTLWKLKEKGYAVIPITGRPAGWCDMIIRQWPVDAVVGENGAFAFYVDEGGAVKHKYHPAVEKDAKKKLERIASDVQRQIPGTRIAKDQFSRLFDLAIDFREEPPFLDYSAAEDIKKICESHGAEAKISSIHVNTWFGQYNKLSMSMTVLQDIYGFTENTARKEVIFFGDSPNDEPMFDAFPKSCGVANIISFLPALKYPPAYITHNSHGRGFQEAVNKIIDAAFL